MYHHLAVAPTSTKNSHAPERVDKGEREQRSQYGRNNSKDTGKHSNNKGGSSRAPSNGQRNSQTNTSQHMAGGRMASGSHGSGQGMMSSKQSKKQN